MSLKSINLERADFIYQEIIKLKTSYANKDKELKKKMKSCYKSYAKSIPAYIKQNGLLATYVFLETKIGKGKVESEVYAALYDLTKNWLIKYNSKEFKKEAKISTSLFNLSSDRYKSAEQEILSLFTWVRRFAEGEMREEEVK